MTNETPHNVDADWLKDVFGDARAQGRSFLSEPSAKSITEAFGLTIPRGVVVPQLESIPACIEALHYPLVLKLISPEILHKSDSGAVVTGLTSSTQVQEAAVRMLADERLRHARFDGFLVEEMAVGETEMFVGGVFDEQFGSILTIGLGGVLLEILDDVAFGICPVSRDDVMKMLEGLRGFRILEGARGRPPVDIDSLAEIVMRVGGLNGLLTSLEPEIDELDINPLILGPTSMVAADVRMVLTPRTPRPSSAVRRSAIDPERLEALFRPRTIAVAGASSSGGGLGNRFIRQLRAFGYSGELYAVHPTADSIEGVAAFRSLSEMPAPVDYAYVTVPAASVPRLLAGANNNAKFAQVVSSGFGETDEGRGLQTELLRAAEAGGVRVLGPNCLGTFSPRGHVTFIDRSPTEPGPVGVISQSGGLGSDIIRRGKNRGLRFSGLVTIGNAADVDASDILGYYLSDSATQVIGLYLESASNGRRLFETLRQAGAAKPVVLLQGGQTTAGQSAAASHTGALMSDDRIWRGFALQTGVTRVATLDEFLDALVAFQMLRPFRERVTEKVVLFGNGGGTSVLASDAFALQGLQLPVVSGPTLRQLEALNLPPGTSLRNPVDAPAGTLIEREGKVAGDILGTIIRSEAPDAVVVHLNLAVMLSICGEDSPVMANLIDVSLRAAKTEKGDLHFVLVLRSDGEDDVERARKQYTELARRSSIPVFSELADAAHALRAVRDFEQFSFGRER